MEPLPSSSIRPPRHSDSGASLYSPSIEDGLSGRCDPGWRRIALKPRGERPAAEDPDDPLIADAGVQGLLASAHAVHVAGQALPVQLEHGAQGVVGVLERDEPAGLLHIELRSQARVVGRRVVPARNGLLGFAVLSG